MIAARPAGSVIAPAETITAAGSPAAVIDRM
jgi:hypothetical protein